YIPTVLEDLYKKYGSDFVAKFFEVNLKYEFEQSETKIETVIPLKNEKIYLCEDSKDDVYYVSENDDKLIINNMMLPCDCMILDEELKGKCIMCKGETTVDDLECPMCQGSGICYMCDGEGKYSLKNFLHQNLVPFDIPVEPIPSRKELEKELTDLNVPDKVHNNLIDYILERDQIAHDEYVKWNKFYQKFFDTKQLPYPANLFPIYIPTVLEDLYNDDEVYISRLLVNDHPRVLAFKENDNIKLELIKIKDMCEMFDESPEIHQNYTQCPCAEETTDGKPLPDCEFCFGTGILICSLCLGTGWTTVAPDPVAPEHIDNPERYKQGVEEFIEIFTEDK
ncbi:MAG: hypothetical protein PF689_09620, partial [Deltaproteobacteria bacterium]|nr:hypothetical protein [Deltaproteobacteria bacterium]